MSEATEVTPPRRRARWQVPAIAGGAAAVIALGLIVGIQVGRADQARTTASPTPSKPLVLDSPQLVVSRLAQLGAPCEGLALLDSPLNATARGHCYVSGKEIVVSTYATRGDVEQQWIDMSSMLNGISDLCMGRGMLWTVSGEDCGYVRRASQLLDGYYQEQLVG